MSSSRSNVTPARVAKASKKSRGRGKKVVEDATTPGFEGGALAALKDANLLDVFTYLTPEEAVKWTLTNRTFATFFASKDADLLWRALLSSAEVDKYGEYRDKVSAPHRAQMEAHFSCRRVVSALLSTSCSACGAYAESLCAMTCTRICSDCWASIGVGNHGIVVQPLSMCSIGYVKTHYLLSDKDIKAGLFCLEVIDNQKSHGLVSPKTTIVLESEARKLAEEKFKHVEGGLAAEKTSRAGKAMEKWEAKGGGKEAKASKGAKVVVVPKEPDSVRKEREKGAPVHYNFVAANQAFISQRPRVAKLYGFYHKVYARSPAEILTQPPSVFVTRDTPAEVMATHPHVTQALLDAGKCKVLTNLIQAVWDVPHGGTILVDMPCNLALQANQVGAAVRDIIVAGPEDVTVGGEGQPGCMLLLRDVKLLGTSRGSISSRRCAMWTSLDTAVVLEGLAVSVTCYNSPAAPVLVLVGHSSVTRCTLSTDTSGFALLLHGQSSELVYSTIKSTASSMTAHVDRVDNLTVLGNRFEHLPGMENLGIFYDDAPQHGERPVFTHAQERAHAQLVDKHNHEIFVYNDYDDDDYGGCA